MNWKVRERDTHREGESSKNQAPIVQSCPSLLNTAFFFFFYYFLSICITRAKYDKARILFRQAGGAYRGSKKSRKEERRDKAKEAKHIKKKYGHLVQWRGPELKKNNEWALDLHFLYFCGWEIWMRFVFFVVGWLCLTTRYFSPSSSNNTVRLQHWKNVPKERG